MDTLRRLADRTESYGWIRALLVWGGLTVVLAIGFAIAGQGPQTPRGLIGLLAVNQAAEQWVGAGGVSASAAPMSQLIRWSAP